MLETMGMLVSKYSGLFLEGIKYTLLLAAIAVALGTVIGTILAILKMAKFKPLTWIATAYIEVFRGTPLLLQLYLFYFLVPKMLPFDPSKFACIQAVDKGQTEAARSLGLNAFQTMWKVVLPQALKNILPALGNEFVTVIKETSLASTFFIGDLMTCYRTINGALYLTLEPLIIVGIIYFVLTFSLSKLIAYAERRLHHDN